ncbi:MAG: hypothetical protein HDT25_02760 [Ruminococcus sp.]|nr:hypothetical protein [Ruminococcus sp.]
MVNSETVTTATAAKNPRGEVMKPAKPYPPPLRITDGIISAAPIIILNTAAAIYPMNFGTDDTP